VEGRCAESDALESILLSLSTGPQPARRIHNGEYFLRESAFRPVPPLLRENDSLL
jgi:hypothetical protein